jgi:lysozyme family protein
MQDTFEKIFPHLIQDEGTKYTDDPDDNGGATKYGITQSRLRLWRNDKNLSKQAVKDLTLEEAKSIYHSKHYWHAMKCDDLPAGLDYSVFDFGVNSGPARSARYLQTLVGVEPDGKIGPATLKAVHDYVEKIGITETIAKFSTGRRNYLRKLDDFPKYGKGWISRVNRVEAKSKELAK